MSILDQIATRIIKEQELIIGPVAWYEAKKVSGLRIINQSTGEVSIENGDNGMVIDKLVAQYDRLFGKASREVSKEAAKPFLASLAPADVPASLK